MRRVLKKRLSSLGYINQDEGVRRGHRPLLSSLRSRPNGKRTGKKMRRMFQAGLTTGGNLSYLPAIMSLCETIRGPF